MDKELEIKKLINSLTNYERHQWVKSGARKEIGAIKTFIGIRQRRKQQGHFDK